MIILGLNINHADTSACLVINGKIEFAIEEERFTRIKHYSAFPLNSIEACLKNSNLVIKDIDYVCVNYDPKSNFIVKSQYLLQNLFTLHGLKKLINFRKKFFLDNDLSNFLKKNKFNGKFVNVEHHLSHISSSYLVSGFDDAIGLTIDGFGDFTSTASFICNKNEIKNIKRVTFPHSLGILYQSITQFLGFKNYGDEYKVMGLASYGKPTYQKEFSKLISYNSENYFKLNLDYFSHHNNPNFSFKFKDGIPYFENLFNDRFYSLFGEDFRSNEITSKHYNLASTLQNVFEEIVLKILNDLYKKYKIDNLCLAGGCALNSKFNGMILKKTNFKKVFIQPNASDGGGSLGAAMYLSFQKDKKFENINFNDAYLGTSYSNDYIKINIIDKKIKNSEFNYEYLDSDSLNTFICNKIKNSEIIGWFKGKCEWGPRALGNRSILADPRNPDIKDIINQKIKRRESFRPFAPSVLEEKASSYFDIDYFSPHMLFVVEANEDIKNKFPAIVHVDNTCRVQTVSKKFNENYYNLIKRFEEITECPVLLNTSFNENEPIVQTPEEAFACFERTKMDCLVLENWVIYRS
jgi:carbamoyltransferase